MKDYFMDDEKKAAQGDMGETHIDPAASEFIARQKKAAELYAQLDAANALLEGRNTPNMRGQYILGTDGKTPIPVADTIIWAHWFERASRDRSRVLGFTKYWWGTHVSTVFLGLDHCFGDGSPLLWETMIFGGDCDEYQRRYSSYDEAARGHKRAETLAQLRDRKYWYRWPWRVFCRRCYMRWIGLKMRWEYGTKRKLKALKARVVYKWKRSWNDGIDWIIAKLS